MIRRFAAVAAAAATGLLAALVIAAPASAGSWEGCVGPTCSAGASSPVHLTGNRKGPVYLAPAPCNWSPVGNQAKGSHYVISYYNGKEPGPNVPRAGSSFQEAKGLLKNPQPGSWYALPVNPDAPLASQHQCERLPYFVFVPQGEPIPKVAPTGRLLARYAFSMMRIPDPTLTLNPAGKSYVNLATYVWADWNPSWFTNRKDLYQIVARAGNDWARVSATPSDQLTIDVTGPGTPYKNGCGTFGSQYPVGHAPANAGAGTPPDCGVLWQSSDSNATITVTVTWNVTWQASNNRSGTLPAITVRRQVQVPVNEIQSVNGN